MIMDRSCPTQTETRVKPTTATIKFPPQSQSEDKLKDKSIELNSSFLFHGGVESELDNIEMIEIQSVSYTSLKDLIPSSTSPGSLIMSPSGSVTHHNSSWYEYEIPIKNPLVKHAALAYLQPMSTPPEVCPKGFLARLRDRCFGDCGCVGWLGDVVSGAFRGVLFWADLRPPHADGDDEIDDDDEEHQG